jgi:hypothetical protein
MGSVSCDITGPPMLHALQVCCEFRGETHSQFQRTRHGQDARVTLALAPRLIRVLLSPTVATTSFSPPSRPSSRPSRLRGYPHRGFPSTSKRSLRSGCLRPEYRPNVTAYRDHGQDAHAITRSTVTMGGPPMPRAAFQNTGDTYTRARAVGSILLNIRLRAVASSSRI